MGEIFRKTQIGKLSKIIELIFNHLSNQSFKINYSPNEAIRCIYAWRPGSRKRNAKQIDRRHLQVCALIGRRLIEGIKEKARLKERKAD